MLLNLLLGLGLSTGAFALTQEVVTTLDQLNKGEMVRVQLKNGSSLDGRVVRVTQRSVVLKLDGLGTTIQKRKLIAKVSRIRETRRHDIDSARKVGSGVTRSTTTPPRPVPPSRPNATSRAALDRIEPALRRWRDLGKGSTSELIAELSVGDEAPAIVLSGLMKYLNPKLWTTAADALTRMHDRKAVKELSKLTSHPSRDLRMTALGVMIELSPDAGPYLAALRDTDPAIRGRAVQAIGKNIRPEYMSLIGDMISDPDRDVRKKAARVLTTRAPELDLAASASGWVADALNSGNRDVREECISTLGKLGTNEAVWALQPYLDNSEMKTRMGAARALGRIETLSSKEALRDAIEAVDDDESTGFLIQLIQSVGRVKPREAVPRLIEFLDHENPTVVKNAHRALESITHARGLPTDSARWRAWWDRLDASLKFDTPLEEEEER